MSRKEPQWSGLRDDILKFLHALDLKKNAISKCKLKLVSAIFYQVFIFSPNDRPSKTVKNVFYFI